MDRGRVGKNTVSIFKYEGVIRKAIIALKYKFSLEIAKELAEACVKQLSPRRYLSSAVLVPIPMHWRKENIRGFNQSAEVGRMIAQKKGWKFESNLLIKTKSTPPQVGLKGSARRENLDGVFSLNSQSRIPGFVVLFDDVYTTGSTITEAGNILKKGGAKRVLGLTIAR